jgi:predicted nucleotidyltransferase
MEMSGVDSRFRRDVEQAIEYLQSVGCSEIYLFGSVGKNVASKESDIDIAVRGIRPEQFFFVYGELMMRLKHRVDLVDLDLQQQLGRSLIETGNLKRVA